MRFVLFACLAFALHGCAEFTAPPTPTSSCTGRTCRGALAKAAEVLACDEADVVVRKRNDDRIVGTGCLRRVTLACEGSTCRVVDPVRTLGPAGEARYRASIALLCDTDDVTLEGEASPFLARCRGVSVEVRCSERGCADVRPSDETLYSLRALEPEVLDCAGRSRLPLDLHFDAQGHLMRIEGDDLRVIRLRGDSPHRRPGPGVSGCLAEVFEQARIVDPNRSGDVLRFYFGGSQDHDDRTRARAATPAAEGAEGAEADAAPGAPPPTAATPPETETEVEDATVPPPAPR